MHRVFGMVLEASGQRMRVSQVVRNSPADKVGIRAGDLVAEINGATISGSGPFEQIVLRHLGEMPLTFLVVRGNRGYYIDLP